MSTFQAIWLWGMAGLVYAALAKFIFYPFAKQREARAIEKRESRQEADLAEQVEASGTVLDDFQPPRIIANQVVLADTPALEQAERIIQQKQLADLEDLQEFWTDLYLFSNRDFSMEEVARLLKLKQNCVEFAEAARQEKGEAA